MRRLLHPHERNLRLELDVPRALGQYHPHLDLPVAHAFVHLRPLQEGDFEHVASPASRAGVLERAQEGPQVRVPADAEAVVPAAEDGVARAQFEESLLLAAPEARRADVADVVGEVRVHAAGLEGHAEGAQGARRRVVVRRQGPLDAGELLLELGA